MVDRSDWLEAEITCILPNPTVISTHNITLHFFTSRCTFSTRQIYQLIELVNLEKLVLLQAIYQLMASTFKPSSSFSLDCCLFHQLHIHALHSTADAVVAYQQDIFEKQLHLIFNTSLKPNVAELKPPYIFGSKHVGQLLKFRAKFQILSLRRSVFALEFNPD